MQFDPTRLVNARTEIQDIRVAWLGNLTLRWIGEQVQGMARAVQLHRHLPRPQEFEIDALTFDGRLNAARGGPHHHRLEGLRGSDFHLDGARHSPVGEARQLRLVQRPLIARPHLVEGHGRDPTGVYRHRLAVHPQRVALKKLLFRRSRPAHHPTMALRAFPVRTFHPQTRLQADRQKHHEKREIFG